MKSLPLLNRYVFLLAMVLFTPGVYASLPVADSQGQTLPSLAPMLGRVTPAVVNIATTSTVRIRENPLFADPFFRHFFQIPDQQQPRTRTTQSLGSGVVVDAKHGYIITNNHVIDKADEIRVTLRDGRNLKAKLIGTDPDTDVAVIQVPAKDLTAVPLADSDKQRVGDFVVAIGNPFGLGQTVTSGIISAKGRSGLGIEGYEDFIQTDASINPGNSGGALVNLKGEIIGINTAIFSQSGGNIGIGFAIPINMVKNVMQQLISHGEVHRGSLGAQAQDLTPELAQAFNIKHRHAAIITEVDKGSAADRAGLKAGDIVTRVNDKTVRDATSLRNTIGLLRVGQSIKLEILREGKARVLTAHVGEPHSNVTNGEKMSPHLAGAQLSNIEEGSPLFGKVSGVVISGVKQDSPAWRAGLRRGDVITSANQHSIHNIDDLGKAVGQSPSLLINVRRGNGALFLYLQ